MTDNFELSGFDYQSPINRIQNEMQTVIEEDVMKAVLSYGIQVDKKELIRALQYDRQQYEKGFADGRKITADGVEVVRCKDCVHSKHWYRDKRLCSIWDMDVWEDGYCNYGERKEQNDDGE